MTIAEKRDALNNSLRTFNFPDKFFIVQSDRRTGLRFAIASNTEIGGIQLHSGYYTYEEMNSFLMGYNTALTNPLK